jgi:DNA-binding CsgD family transcriptional regulator
MALAERDVRLALGIVEAAAATQNGSPFGTELLDALIEAIPALTVDYMERRVAEAPAFSMAAPSDVWPAQVEVDELLARVGSSYPLNTVEHATSSEPLRLTDFVSARAFRRTAAYAVTMRPFGVEYELKLWLPAPPGHTRCFCFARGPGKDFSTRDLDLLRLVRPHLAGLRARWERGPRPAQLTERERDVLELVAQGLTNREVARRLFISPLTVRKHLEHVYEKLGVRTRAGAVAAAFRAAS